MKKFIFCIIIFVLFTVFVKLCPTLTMWDKEFIILMQTVFGKLPLWLFELPDCKLYSVMLIIPLILGGLYFLKRKMYSNILFLFSIPLAAFLLNCIIKPLIHRARPPYELQFSIHPESFSYVSSHSLVTFCLWGAVIYFLNKYCKNKVLKYLGTVAAILWIIFVGLSRIYLAVHYPSDVLGAYLLGATLLSLYIKISNKGAANE